MDYPFPGPKSLPALIWTVVVVLLILAAVPLVRMLARKRKASVESRPYPSLIADRVVAGIGAVATLGIAGLFPFGPGRMSPGIATFLLALLSAVVALHICWAVSITRPGADLWRRILEVVVPYGIAGMVFFVLITVRDSQAGARSAQCRGKLKYLLFGLHNYHDVTGTFPTLATDDELPPRSWRVDLLPYLDHIWLREQYVDQAAWDAEENRPVTHHRPESGFVYDCPSSPRRDDEQGRLFAAYFGVRGPNTLFPDGRASRIKDVTDGTSNTIAIVEACGRPIVWTEPRDIDLAEQAVGVNLPGEQPGRSRGVISSYHHAGGHVGLADGSVRFVSEKIDPNLLRALLSANGGDAAVGF